MNKREVKIPEVELIKTKIADSISVESYTGVLILRDQISDTDSETGLIVSLDAGRVSFKTSNSDICSGVVVSVSKDFMTKYTGVMLEIGDRVLANINKTIPINLADKDGITYNLLNIREEDILAIIDVDTNLKV